MTGDAPTLQAEAGQIESVEVCTFGDLTIAFDASVLRPRPWTLAQSEWAAELLPDLPAGPVLEVCAGVGHIGLAAVAGIGRDLVLADASGSACRFARVNADRAGRAGRVQVRETRLEDLPDGEERFALLIADPPWVPSADVDRFPEDPRTAIDGGDDGMGVAWACLELAERAVLPGGAMLLQLGTADQAMAVARRGVDEQSDLHVREVRTHEPDGVLVLLVRRP